MSRHPYYVKLITSKKWVKLRRLKLTEAKYLCQECAKKDITTPATEVHHIAPVESGISDLQMKALCYNYDNLIALCRKCHNQAHEALQSNSMEEVQKRNKQRTEYFTERFFKRRANRI